MKEIQRLIETANKALSPSMIDVRLAAHIKISDVHLSALAQFEKEASRMGDFFQTDKNLRWASGLSSAFSQLEEVSSRMEEVFRNERNLRWASGLSSTVMSALSRFEEVSSGIGEVFCVDEKLRWAFGAHFHGGLSKFIENYECLVTNLNDSENDDNLAKIVVVEPTREFIATSVTINSFLKRSTYLEPNVDEVSCTEEINVEVKETKELLHKFDPALCAMLDGAVNACKKGGTDSCRHVLTSLRELLDHLIRSLAPDEAVIPWVPDRSFLNKDRPTRKARIHYICRNMNSPHFTSFLNSDTTAILEFFNLLQRLHEKVPPFTREQTEILVLRAQSYILFLLRIL